MTDEVGPERTKRGRLILYGVAFIAMLAAGAVLAVAARDFLANTALLWASTGLSLTAFVLAILAMTLPRRR